jgi:DNA modification methylase
MESLPISKVRPNSDNPRYIKDEKFKKLVQSLRDFPEMANVRPIVVNTEMVVLGGNMRLKAMQEAGWSEVPVQVVDWSEEKQREFIIKDNVGFGEWDWDELANTWDAEELNEWGLDTPDNWKAEELEAEEDDYEVPEELKTDVVLGDLIEIGEHRLLCGDSTDSDQVAKLMNGEKADMVFTDPPYGINEKGDRSKRGGLAKGNNLPDFIDDSIQYAIDAFNQPQNLDIPIQVWFGANYYCHSLPQGNNWLVWDKRVEEKQRDTQSDCELAWVKSRFNSVRIFRHLWKGMMKDSERGQRRVHATQKPIALIEFALNEYGSKEGDLVIDYFTGSGSTMVAAHQLKRKCYGMELDPKYCQVIIDRMTKLDPTLSVKINGKEYVKTTIEQ